MSEKRPIGILGGTFDPIHNGHLAIAEHVTDQLDLQIIEFIPNHTPPHRDKPNASPQHRLAMTQAAVSGYENFIVNDIEIMRTKKPSYMVETLKQLRKNIPDQPICLIIGEDALHELNQWHQWKDLLKFSHLVVISRIDIKQQKAAWLEKLLKDHCTCNSNDLTNQPAGKIYFCEIDPINISASNIRKKIKEGKNVSALVPLTVLHYIQQHHLYM